MIHWKEVQQPMAKKERERWRRTMCGSAMWDNGRCDGYSLGPYDDEPCEVCKSCDKLMGGLSA